MTKLNFSGGNEKWQDIKQNIVKLRQFSGMA